MAVLEDCGFDITTSDVEYCGMTGSFGYKSGYYELSVDAGETLVNQFTTEDTVDRTIVASGTSCLEQLDALLTRRPTHPVRLRYAVAVEARASVDLHQMSWAATFRSFVQRSVGNTHSHPILRRDHRILEE